MKLKDLIPLKSKITVYVPATVDINKEIDNTAQVVTLCNELKHEMGQEAVALEYNGSMYFI